MSLIVLLNPRRRHDINHRCCVKLGGGRTSSKGSENKVGAHTELLMDSSGLI